LLREYQGLMSGSRAMSFAEVCEKYSDCSSAKKGGDLGFFGRGEMQKTFEGENVCMSSNPTNLHADAAFSLEVGQFSGVVESGSGVHIIQRTA
jgi:peptidyl-prolyl cis-trans isomerase NIMA-interacting 1